MTDPLAPFFVTTPRRSPNLSGRDGFRGRVDAIVNELALPAQIDPDGDWAFETDVGRVLLIVDNETQDLLAMQIIQAMERKPNQHADVMHLLLSLNLKAVGAYYACASFGDDSFFVLTARRRPHELTSQSVQEMLADCLRESRRFDEMVGSAPGRG